MDKLTLDTNVLRDWLWCEGKRQEKRHSNDLSRKEEFKCLFGRLRALRDSGTCEIGVTSQLYTDHHRTSSRLPKHIEEMIGTYVILCTPSVSTFPLVFPAVFVEPDKLQQLFEDIFPASKPHHKNYRRNMKDALQLYAHKVARRDLFITLDSGIRQKQSVLCEKWGIRVMSLQEYVDRHTMQVTRNEIRGEN